MSQHRQLVAIMFTDIEGYTSIMQENEQKALRWKNRHREILQREHQQFNGRIIQYYGDGTLSIFHSAVNAVDCALAMQQEFRKDQPVPVRMGLHSGDIIIDEDQVFGDGVNLASRIESLGVPGSVLLSDKVQDELLNHPRFKTLFLGSFQFKNVKSEVKVFVLNHPDLVVPSPGELKGKTEQQTSTSNNKPRKTIRNPFEKSIAVLPFINLSDDPDQEYFGEGVGEEILNSLSNLKDLKVASRSSSFQFRGRSINLEEIREKLGVNTILHGSIRKQGRRLRLMVQLINVEDGFHLWSEKYDRNIDDVFAIQDEVALAITEKLKVTLLEKDRELVTKTHTQNPEAYELYLKGRFYMNKRGASVITAIHCFQLAIDLDPEFTLAYTGFADANLVAGFYGMLPPGMVMERARKAAEKALSIDPARCEPYCTLGCLAVCFDRNWKAAETHFLTSLDLNPKYIQAHYWYGSLYLAWAKGDFLGAITHGRIAVEQEPQSAITLGMYGSILYTSSKFQEALYYCKLGSEVEPDSFICHLFTGLSHLALKHFEEAVQVFEDLLKATNRFHLSLNALIITYAQAWKFAKAKELLKELKERALNEYTGFTFTGIALAHLDELDDAFEYLERAFAEREPILLSLKYQHWVPENLREDVRFKSLLNRIGYP